MPTSISSPSLSSCSLTRTPFTRVPLVEPRSKTTTSEPRLRISACLRLTFGSFKTTAHSGRRPRTNDCAPTLIRRPSVSLIEPAGRPSGPSRTSASIE